MGPKKERIHNLPKDRFKTYQEWIGGSSNRRERFRTQHLNEPTERYGTWWRPFIPGQRLWGRNRKRMTFWTIDQWIGLREIQETPACHRCFPVDVTLIHSIGNNNPLQTPMPLLNLTEPSYHAQKSVPLWRIAHLSMITIPVYLFQIAFSFAS